MGLEDGTPAYHDVCRPQVGTGKGDHGETHRK